jgi:GntR family transcriptional regulator, rspAB operon transcriptional repressor
MYILMAVARRTVPGNGPCRERDHPAQSKTMSRTAQPQTALTKPARRDGQSVGTAHQLVREAILSGRFPPGSHTTQVAIGRELGLGRTPLREALRMLERDGLIELEPNQRIRIAPLSVGDVEELYAMRIALETLAICKTVQTFSQADIAELERLCEVASDEGDAHEGAETARAERAQAAHDAFHARFTAGAGGRLSAAIDQLTDHAERYRLVNLLPSSYGDRDETRREMLAAAIERDGNRAASVFGAHCVRRAHELIAELSPDATPALYEIALERSLAP